MAADWIKIEKATPRKPEVLRLAGMLGVHPEHAFGLCFLFWSWCDDHLTDCYARGVTKVMIDASLSCNGFAQAMIDVGWLAEENGEVVVPNFDRHLSKSAKNRALTAIRMASRRHKSDAPSVTKSEQNAHLEKRREEKIKECSSTKNTSSEPASPPSEPAVLAIPCVKGKTWSLTQSQVTDWAAVYPGVDVLAECRKAAAWLQANPERIKTHKGMPRFLNAWLSRCQDRGGSVRTGGTGFGPSGAANERQSELERRRARSMERLGLKPEGES